MEEWIMSRQTWKFPVVALVLALLSTARVSSAQTWVGTTGVVDRSSSTIYSFSGPAASVIPSVSSGTVTLRYNILPVSPLNEQIDLVTYCWSMGVQYLDNGSNARVTVALRRHNLLTNERTTLLTFDSNTQSQGSSFMTGHGNSCGFFNFSFLGNPRYAAGPLEGADSVYYFEAKLIRSGSGGTPALAAIWLEKFYAG
jgi:hypothetical protein